MTPDELRAYGDAVVNRLLRENEHRWRSLTPADRLLVESLAAEVAARLLEEPAVAYLLSLPQSESERRTRASV